MLEQLWGFWQRYDRCEWSPSKLELEVAIWVSQHCLDADDFAFGMATGLLNGLHRGAIR